MPMQFDPTIGLGSVITMIVLGSGLIGGWFTLKTEFKEAGRRQSDVEVKQERLEAEIQAHKLHVVENFVRRNDFQTLEDRIGKMMSSTTEPIIARMKEIDHKVGNINSKIDERVLSVLRIRGRREESE